MDTPHEGDRVELVSCDDPYTRLAPGSQGTVTGVNGPLRYFDNMTQVHVRWDDGSTLSLLEGKDRFKILERVGLE